jgi:cell wall-associated NlpC family hydrolase
LFAALVAGLLALGLTACGREPEANKATTQAKPPPEEPGNFDLSSRPKAVDVEGAGNAPDPKAGEGISPGAQSDEEVRREVKQADKELASFEAHLDNASLTTGARARVLKDGTAVAPRNAPDVVKRVILAGNQIAKFPYKWGGGHGAWRDSGYDCSGSVSFALAGAGLLKAPMASGPFMRWGAPGAGRWITIYASPGHIFMFVAGLRFDTSGRGRAGTRWQTGGRTAGGFAVRHPPHF